MNTVQPILQPIINPGQQVQPISVKVSYDKWGKGLLTFAVLTFAVWVAYYTWPPSFVKAPNGSIDNVRLLIAALITAAVLSLIFWLFSGCGR